MARLTTCVPATTTATRECMQTRARLWTAATSHLTLMDLLPTGGATPIPGVPRASKSAILLTQLAASTASAMTRMDSIDSVETAAGATKKATTARATTGWAATGTVTTGMVM